MSRRAASFSLARAGTGRPAADITRGGEGAPVSTGTITFENGSRIGLPEAPVPESPRLRGADDPREARLQRLVEAWARRLRLNEHWQIKAQLVPPMENQSAEVRYNSYTWTATVRVCRDIAESDWPWEVVHELYHLLLAPMRVYTDRLIGQLDPRQFTLFDELRRDMEEPLINMLTETLIDGRTPYTGEGRA